MKSAEDRSHGDLAESLNGTKKRRVLDEGEMRSDVVFATALPCLAEAQDIDRGREMAERWCANCHVVGRSAQAGRADGLPTFPAIAAKKETTAASLRGAMTAAHAACPTSRSGRAIRRT
jgi:mono/diheme cytochrome c family protein